MIATMHLDITARATRGLRAIGQTKTAVGGLTTQLNAATVAASRLDARMRLRNLDRFAKDMQWIGRQIEFNFTLPLLLAGGFATKWALENEKAMTRLKKVYNENTEDTLNFAQETQELGRSFRLLSDIMGVHQAEVINIGASWAQAGANGRALAEVTKLTMETMILGEMEAADATEALLAIQQQFQVQVADTSNEIVSLTDIMATLNAVENETAVTFQGLVEAFQRSAGIARSAGVTHRELAGAVAAIVPAGADATVAGNMLRTTISRIMAPTGQTSDALAELGINTDSAAWASKTFTDRLFTLSDAYKELSTDERARLASIVAGRRQVSRFNILMDDLISNQSRYAKALEASATQEKAMATFRRELEMYLTSTPQGFNILTNQIKNLMTEAIQPLLPMMLNFLTVLRDMMRSFQNMSNSQKQLIFYLGLFLILVGPLMRITNALILLFNRLVAVVLFAGRVFGFLTARATLLKAALGKKMKAAAKAAVAGMKTLAAGFMSIVRGAMIMMSWLPVIITRGWATVAGLWARGMAALVALSAKGWLAVQRVWVTFWAVVQGVIKFPALIKAFGLFFVTAARTSFKGFLNLRKIWAVGVALLASPWVWLVVAIVGIIATFRDQIIKFLRDIGKAWNLLPQSVANALTNVIRVISAAAKAIYEWLSYLNPFARHSPSLVEQVKAGVKLIANEYASLSNIGRVFGKAVTDLQNFIKATDQARRAMRSSEFAELRVDVVAAAPSAGGAFDAVVSSIYELESVLGRIQKEYDAQAQVVNRWEAALDAANFELEAQQVILDELTYYADRLKTQLDDATARLNALTETPIAGMGAMADAIFENEMAQKALRLELLRMEETYGTIDGVRERMAALSGDIDMLVAHREDLRMAGAGSDVLGAIDAQIAQLEAERRALGSMDGGGGPASQMDELRKQLAELERQGEILSLEESLAFDPLTRQIEKITTAVEEMPFDELLAKIIAEQENVNKLTAEWEDANAAMLRQSAVVDELAFKRDQIQATYDLELGKLERLADAYDSIEQQISDMVTALEEFAQASAAASAAAGGGAAGGAGDLLGPGGDFPIAGGTGADLTGGDLPAFNDMLEGMRDELFKFDIGAMLREEWNKAIAFLKTKWNEFLEWLGLGSVEWGEFFESIQTAFSDLWKGVKGKFEEIWENIDWGRVEEFLAPIITIFTEAWDEIVGFAEQIWANIQDNWDIDLQDVLNTVSFVWDTIVGIVTFVAGLIMAALTVIWPIVRNVISVFFSWIADIIGSIIQVIGGIIKFISGVFTGDWRKAFEGLWDIVSGVMEGIITTIARAVELVIGFFAGIVEGIWDLFVWLYDVLIGNSIIPDIVNGIVKWFKMLVDLVLAPVRWLRDKIVEVWNTVKNWTTEKFSQMRDSASGAMGTMKDRVTGHLNLLRDKFGEVKAWVDSKIIGVFRWVRDTASGIWDSVKTKITTVFNTIERIVGGVMDKVTGFITGVQEAWNKLTFSDKTANVKASYKPTSTYSGGSSYSYTYSPPATGYFASGGVLTQPTLAMMGEYSGVRNNPEIITPERLMTQVFSDVLDSKLESMSGGSNRIVNINGNLEFPNISDGGDAEEFVRNLEALAV